MATPLDLRRTTNSNRRSVSVDDSAVVGSSRIRMLGCCDIALMISVSCCWPALNSETSKLGSMSMPSSPNRTRAWRSAWRSSIKPRPSRSSRVRKMFCATLSVGTRLISWKIIAMPALRAASGVFSVSSTPPTSILLPSSGV